MMTTEDPFPSSIRKTWVKSIGKISRTILFSNDFSPSISQGLDIYTPFDKEFR